jgi:hypothetical protein
VVRSFGWILCLIYGNAHIPCSWLDGCLRIGHVLLVYHVFLFGCVVRAAAFDAVKRFVAVRFGVAILLISPALCVVGFTAIT